MTPQSTNLQNGRVQWTGNYQLPVPRHIAAHQSGIMTPQCRKQSIAFMKKNLSAFPNLNENLTILGIMLLKKRPRRVHVVVAQKPRRICAVKRFSRNFITFGMRIGFTPGERPWLSSQ